MHGGFHHVHLSHHHPTPSWHHHHNDDNCHNDDNYHDDDDHHHHHNVMPMIFTNNNRRNQPHAFYHSSSSSPASSSAAASIRGCCCCLILLFSFLALLLLTVVLVVVLAVKPKKPHFDLEQVGVQYISLAAPANTPTTDSASLSLAIRMLFVAENDNLVGIKYGVSTFNIMYRGIPLGRGSVPGFYQPAHSVRQVQTTVTVDRANLLQADATDLVRDASLNDRVELRIIGDVNAKIRILGLTSPSVQVNDNNDHLLFHVIFY